MLSGLAGDSAAVLLGNAAPDVPGGQRDPDRAHAAGDEMVGRRHAGILVVVAVAAVAVVVPVPVSIIVAVTIVVAVIAISVALVASPVVVSAAAAAAFVAVVVVVVVIVPPSLGLLPPIGLALLGFVFLRLLLLRFVLLLVLAAFRAAVIVIVVVVGRWRHRLRRGRDGFPRGWGRWSRRHRGWGRCGGRRRSRIGLRRIGLGPANRSGSPRRGVRSERDRISRGERRRDDRARRKRGQRRQRRGLKIRWGRQQLAAAPLQVALHLRRQPDGLLLRPGAGGAR